MSPLNRLRGSHHWLSPTGRSLDAAARRAARADAAQGVPHPFADGVPPFLENLLANAGSHVAQVRRAAEGRAAKLEARHARSEVKSRSRSHWASARADQVASLERRRAAMPRSRLGEGLGRLLYCCVAAFSLAIDLPLNRMAFERLPMRDELIWLLALGICVVLIVVAHLLGGRLASLVLVQADRVEDEVPSARAARVSAALVLLVTATVIGVVLVSLNDLRGQSEQFQVRFAAEHGQALLRDRLSLYAGHAHALLWLQVLMVLVMTWLRFECVLGAGRRELCKRLRRARAWRSWHAWQSRRSEARLHRLASQLAACRAQAHREAEQVVAVHRRVAAEWYELVVQARPEQQESLLSRLDERWAALLAAQQPGLPSAGFVTEGQPRSFNTPHPPVARLARRPLFTHAPSEA